uniref:ELM2 domain-containing protein n=1 Tax=Echinostoma caproni TaxID=27848 RepID=A0A183BD69_9TREM
LRSSGRQEVEAPEERGSGWSKNLDARPVPPDLTGPDLKCYTVKK